MKEQSESLHARLTWKDLLRLDVCSRALLIHPSLRMGWLAGVSLVVLEHCASHQAGTTTSSAYTWPATLSCRYIEP